MPLGSGFLQSTPKMRHIVATKKIETYSTISRWKIGFEPFTVYNKSLLSFRPNQQWAANAQEKGLIQSAMIPHNQVKHSVTIVCPLSIAPVSTYFDCFYQFFDPSVNVYMSIGDTIPTNRIIQNALATLSTSI